MARFVVRFGVMRMVGVFHTRGLDLVPRGTEVIARTARGLESAEVLCEGTDHVLANTPESAGGQILRVMTTDDHNELSHILAKSAKEFESAEAHVARLKLQMQLVDIERLFGGERVVIYYLAEERVDFRELVKILAGEFQTRIEMRQIGVRDEAKLLADYGDCGKPVCCNTHLSEIPPVSMKMAKLQKATLDPTKISGRCGRLKCCLRYEYDTYEALHRELPAIGSELVTNRGRAQVVNHEILSQQLLVTIEDGRRILIPLSDVLTVLRVGPPKRPPRPREGRPDDEVGGAEGDDGNIAVDETGSQPMDNGGESAGRSERSSGDRPSNDRPPNERGSRERGGREGRRDQGPRNQGSRDRGPRRPNQGESAPRKGPPNGLDKERQDDSQSGPFDSDAAQGNANDDRKDDGTGQNGAE
jgi:cell fate regulator YaaT (PSP1 superfamily)